jgi:hypothetical protein
MAIPRTAQKFRICLATFWEAHRGCDVRIAVMAGAVGGYFGGRMVAAGHDVAFIARDWRPAYWLPLDGFRHDKEEGRIIINHPKAGEWRQQSVSQPGATADGRHGERVAALQCGQTTEGLPGIEIRRFGWSSGQTDF